MGKIVVNKHYTDKEKIRKESFTTAVNAFTGEKYREGEIIICNSQEEPGLFIITSGDTEHPAKVIKVNSTDVVTRETDGATLESILEDLQEQINNIPTGSTISIKSTRIEKHEEEFEGDDGKMHPAGTYLVIEFENSDGTTTYSYNDVSELFQEDWYGTEEEYQAMVEAGTIDPNKTYNTYEE